MHSFSDILLLGKLVMREKLVFSAKKWFPGSESCMSWREKWEKLKPKQICQIVCIWSFPWNNNLPGSHRFISTPVFLVWFNSLRRQHLCWQNHGQLIDYTFSRCFPFFQILLNSPLKGDPLDDVMGVENIVDTCKGTTLWPVMIS